MRRLLTALLGLAAFGAIFAAAFYQPQEVERAEVHPKFRLGPGEGAADFIEPGREGENVTINITVLTGGPVDVYVMNMDNLTFRALNGSAYGFEIHENVTYDRNLSRRNVSEAYNFTIERDGENRSALLIVSRVPPEAPAEGEEMTTEVAVTMRYRASETRSLIAAYVLATPSLLLVGFALWRGWRRSRFAER